MDCFEIASDFSIGERVWGSKNFIVNFLRGKFQFQQCLHATFGKLSSTATAPTLSTCWKLSSADGTPVREPKEVFLDGMCPLVKFLGGNSWVVGGKKEIIVVFFLI